MKNHPSSTVPPLSFAGLCLTACLAFPENLSAQENLWTGGDASWFAAENWSLGAAPVAGQAAHLKNGSAVSISGGAAAAGALKLGPDDGTSGSLAVTHGGTLAAHSIRIGDFALGGGSLTVAAQGEVKVNGGFGNIFIGKHGVVKFGNGGAPGRIGADYLVGQVPESDAGDYPSLMGTNGKSYPRLVFDHDSPNLVLEHTRQFMSLEPETVPLNISGMFRIDHHSGVTSLKSHSDLRCYAEVTGGTLGWDGLINDGLAADIGGSNLTLAKAGGTIAGSGTFFGVVETEAGSVLAPGPAAGGVGSLRVRQFTMWKDSVWEVDLADGEGLPGQGWDEIQCSEARFNAIAPPIGKYYPIALRSLDGGVPGPAANFDWQTVKKWRILKLRNEFHDPLFYPASLSFFDPDRFVIDTSAFANDLQGGTFRLEAPWEGSDLAGIDLVFERPSLDTVLAYDAEEGIPADNSPDLEGVENATDNRIDTKYLNFSTHESGLILHRTGTGPVRALTLFSANDHDERDPAQFLLEGSHDGTTFTPVAGGVVPPFIDRHAVQSFPIGYETSFPIYRLSFPFVHNAGIANAMQIAEVELNGWRDLHAPGDTVSLTLPAGASTVLGAEHLIDRKAGDSSKLEVHQIAPGGHTVVDIVPAAGATILKGFEMIGSSYEYQTGFFDRRPSTITVEGTHDGTTFFPLVTGARLEPAQGGFLSIRMQEFLALSNTTAYPRYRFTFGPPIQGDRMQVGEIRLFGDLPVPQLSIQTAAGNALLSWPDTPDCVLEASETLDAASWQPVGIAPLLQHGVMTVTTPISGPRRFFRLRR